LRSCHHPLIDFVSDHRSSMVQASVAAAFAMCRPSQRSFFSAVPVLGSDKL
jgi:hypothetical protein